ncbi:hypothetical protein IEO21_06462 [Rhodonia placenta]|uniref:Ketoreductase (KR) domain-containing protein n=1 Tax=Rhodonia placenta TaxID=104341 RepID=A0A8H7P0F1_9APHY|nr:hypothetical protein IEO21_06462 [Postia placenta]
MVLEVVYAAASQIIPSGYTVHLCVAAVALVIIYAFAQGRSTTRERDLHARVVVVTGAFTPLGLTLLTALASRGAHVIAISDYPLDHAYPSLIIPLLRSTTNNENIFAEHADLSDPSSIRGFCTRFLTGQDQRLDAIVFGHEYHTIGSLLRRARPADRLAEKRETASLATFLMMTLLLPALLVEPAERDIRIVNIVNPFYAASIPAFTAQLAAAAGSPAQAAALVDEGSRALRTAVLTRHLQRVLDSLPNRGPSTGPEQDAGKNKAAPAAKTGQEPNRLEMHPSNIIAVSVCPGISRKDTIVPLLGAERDAAEGWSLFGFMFYVVFFPILFLFTKSPSSALQSVLHVLFLPTPLKRAFAHIDATINPAPTPESTDEKKPAPKPTVVYEEVLKPGALYRECAVAQLNIPPLPSPPEDMKSDEKARADGKGKGKERASMPDATFPDDGEFGGEAVGRAVWEWYEEHLKAWDMHSKRDEGQTKREEAQEAKGEGEGIRTN